MASSILMFCSKICRAWSRDTDLLICGVFVVCVFSAAPPFANSCLCFTSWHSSTCKVLQFFGCLGFARLSEEGWFGGGVGGGSLTA